MRTSLHSSTAYLKNHEGNTSNACNPTPQLLVAFSIEYKRRVDNFVDPRRYFRESTNRNARSGRNFRLGVFVPITCFKICL